MSLSSGQLARRRPGGVVEWLMAPVLKTGEVKASAGSNPAPSVPREPSHGKGSRSLSPGPGRALQISPLGTTVDLAPAL